MDPISIIRYVTVGAQLLKTGADLIKDVQAKMHLDHADRAQLDQALRELQEANDQLYEAVQAKLGAASSRT
jgi:multidrug efflux pump subunit AcrA (membrane-fusion protein)